MMLQDFSCFNGILQHNLRAELFLGRWVGSISCRLVGQKTPLSDRDDVFRPLDEVFGMAKHLITDLGIVIRMEGRQVFLQQIEGDLGKGFRRCLGRD